MNDEVNEAESMTEEGESVNTGAPHLVYFQFGTDSSIFLYFNPLESWTANLALAKSVRDESRRRRRLGLPTFGHLKVQKTSSTEKHHAA